MYETHCTDVPMITALQSFERTERFTTRHGAALQNTNFQKNRCENPNAVQSV